MTNGSDKSPAIVYCCWQNWILITCGATTSFPRVERRSVRPFKHAELNRRVASGFNRTWRFYYCCCFSFVSSVSSVSSVSKLLTLQTATTSISGSICFTRFSIPASVPEIELGQLPHAPW